MIKKTIIFFFLAIALVMTSGFFVSAQTDKEKEKALLEAELKRLEQEIFEANRGITATEAEKQTLQYQINKLQGEINSLTAQINRNRVVIQSLGLKIADTQGSIIKTTEKIAKSQEELAEMLRTLNMEGRISILEILMTEDNLSAVFGSLNSLERLSGETKSVLDEVKNLRRSLQGYKVELESDMSETEKIAKIQELQKAQEEAARRERQRLYGLTEAEYQKQVAEKRKLEVQAAEIRRKLVDLVGVRRNVEYEEFLSIAKQISNITKIRSAFLLGIITQESALGRKVGQCYLRDFDTGMGINRNTNQPWPRVMNPGIISSFYLPLISELNQKRGLNIDPSSTPLSCWVRACRNSSTGTISHNVTVGSNGEINCPSGSVPWGFGGAMGPAQFIPSTWSSVRQRVENITGRTPDPWDVYDALLASAIHLTQDCGALSSEINAAACYFGGSGNRNNSYHISVYSNPVLELATCHQNFIDNNTMNDWCQQRIFGEKRF
jgi:peptidoglycan hydrolase CwlO-like protein